jgi:DNA-binding beta-propeller fold protein YncE
MPVIIFIATLLLTPLAHAQPALQATLLAEQAQELAQPHDAALSPDGKLIYVTDMANSRIVVLDAMTLTHVGAFGKGVLNQTTGKAR